MTHEPSPRTPRSAQATQTPRLAGRVLVVEDDAIVASGLVRGLRAAGFETELATDGTSGARRALEDDFDVILLDLMLGGHSGFDVLTMLEGRRRAPVVVLTARTELEDRLKAFELGAVDFVAKPFWVEEVIARIRVRLHLPKESKPARIVRFADAALDFDARTVEVAGAPVALTRFELDLLVYLIERAGRAVTRQQLATRALGPLDARSERTVDTHVTHLRKKLGTQAGGCIVTVWGIGYRFEPSR